MLNKALQKKISIICLHRFLGNCTEIKQRKIEILNAAAVWLVWFIPIITYWHQMNSIMMMTAIFEFNTYKL